MVPAFLPPVIFPVLNGGTATGGTFTLFCKLNGAIISGHFQITYAAKRLRIALTGENDRTFPIVWSKPRFASQFLRFERSLRFQFDAQSWNGNSPMGWITRARNWACPNFLGWLQGEIS